MIHDGIMIAMYIQVVSYCYWLSAMHNIVWIRHQRFIRENLIFSSLIAMILILQRILRPYQAKTQKNTSSQWMMKFKVL